MKHIMIASLGFAFCCISAYAENPKLNVLLIDGQNNHSWAKTSPVIKEILENTGRFNVEVCTSPQSPPSKPKLRKEDKNDSAKVAAWEKAVKLWEKEAPKYSKINRDQWSQWYPQFTKYDVIVSNYNGQSWPEKVKKDFETYMQQDGGLVVIHAADNSFPKWAEYNKMIGVGGWNGRNEKTAGPMLRLREGQWIQDNTPGYGGTHGQQVEALVVCHEPDHPIMKGLPQQWLHVKDEIYGKLRGPAENVTVLASSFSDKKDNGTGEQEPGLMVIDYHKSRVFHTIYGHYVDQMKGLGFQITLQRGTEWAATGTVTIPVPKQKLSETVAVIAE